MRIAFVGKGGAGKSALAGTLCRVLARRGHRVLALDADSVPGLALSIGIATSDEWMLSTAAVREEGKGWVLRMSPEEAVERFARPGPHGIRFLQYGKPTATLTREQQSSMGAFLQIMEHLGGDGWMVVTDLAAGTRQSYMGWAGAAEMMLTVVEPSAKAIMTARRLGRVGEMVPGVRLLGIANKVTAPLERRTIKEGLEKAGIPLWAEIPTDPVFAAAARVGRAPYDVDPEAPAIRRIEELADRLTAEAHA
jgi:CO dehydrogenase maturation factor